MSYLPNLQQLRKERGLSRQTLAERVQCAASTIQALEIDDREPGLGLVQRLAETLEVSIEALFLQTDTGKKVATEEVSA